jgi:FMN phosphatase YigB (HAD superfamily)
MTLDDDFFASFRAELEDPKRWHAYWTKILGDPSKQDLLPKSYKKGSGIPPVASIDAKEMFWNMMRMARSPDPNIYPALRKLKASGKFIVAALSNTIAFPPGIRDEKGDIFLSGIKSKEVKALGLNSLGEGGNGGGVGDEREDIKNLFDVFISSAHVGMRKPEQRIYDFALEEVRRIGKSKGVEVDAGDIVFLDDIGQNLRMAKERGMRTIKVTLGKSDVALKELEEVVGMGLRVEKGSKL